MTIRLGLDNIYFAIESILYFFTVMGQTCKRICVFLQAFADT